MASEGKKDFNILHDAAGDGELLRLARKHLAKEFPDLHFRFYGNDINADVIGSEISKKNFVIKKASAEDATAFDEKGKKKVFDIILDYGVTVENIISEKQFLKIVNKWSERLVPGGIAMSVPFDRLSWFSKISEFKDLRLLCKASVGGMHDTQNSFRFFIFQKIGGHSITAAQLLTPLDKKSASSAVSLRYTYGEEFMAWLNQEGSAYAAQTVLQRVKHFGRNFDGSLRDLFDMIYVYNNDVHKGQLMFLRIAAKGLSKKQKKAVFLFQKQAGNETTFPGIYFDDREFFNQENVRAIMALRRAPCRCAQFKRTSHAGRAGRSAVK
jgi:hypothetical protein